LMITWFQKGIGFFWEIENLTIQFEKVIFMCTL
jgi:hypothetical protein